MTDRGAHRSAASRAKISDASSKLLSRTLAPRDLLGDEVEQVLGDVVRIEPAVGLLTDRQEEQTQVHPWMWHLDHTAFF